MAPFFTLYVGDPHAELSSLPEMERLISLVEDSARAHEVDRIVFLGDQYHNHSVVHLQVQEFWERSLNRLSHICEVIALVGNHDRAGNSKANSMMLHSHISSVDKSYLEYRSSIVYVGYQDKPQEFIRLCNASKANTVVCHQTFFGSKYENGFYAPQKDSIDPDAIPQKLIISGHIHTAQKFGKVWYTGSPRWRIATDANVEKFIYLVQHEDDGSIVSTHPISTKGTCRAMYHLDDSETAPLVLTNEQREGKVIVDVHGSIEYVKKRKEELEKHGHQTRGFPSKNYTTDIRESDGIQNSFVKFASKYEAKNGTQPLRLLELSKRIAWK